MGKQSSAQVVSLLLVFVVLWLIWPTFPDNRRYRPQHCLSNVKQMGLGVAMNANDYDDHVPDSTAWMDQLDFYLKGREVMHCPELAPQEYGYAFPKLASGIRVGAVKKPEHFAIIFDSTHLGRNAVGELDTMPAPGRHRGSDNVAYLDCHVRSLVVK